MALYHNGRVYRHAASVGDGNKNVRIVNAVTGVPVSSQYYDRLTVDSSGALHWRGDQSNRDKFFIRSNATSHPSGDTRWEGRELPGLERGGGSFRFGVCITKHCAVLRFDGEAEAAVDTPHHEV